MKKRKAFKCIAGLLSAAILFTSEGMSCLAFAAPLEDTVLPPPLAVNATEAESEEPSEEELILPEESEDSAVPENPAAETEESEENTDPADTSEENTEDNEQENPENPVPEEPESPVPEEPNEPLNPDLDNPENPDSENSEEDQIGEDETTEPKEPSETEKPSTDTISDNSLSANNLMTLEEEPPEMTDFAIVDEGGNLLDETKILYIQENAYRQLHVKLTPEEAVADDVIWSSDNARILVTDGKVTLKSAEASDSGVVAGNVSAQIGELIRTCKVEFQPLMKEIIIVDQNGVVIPESGITILPGQQKKLGVKILPEGAVVENARTVLSLADTKYLRIDNRGILTVRTTPREFPHETTLTAEVTNPQTQQTVSATCKVTVPAPGEQDGIRCGDILFYCDGMQKDYQKIDEKTWEISTNRSSYCTLTYLGEKEPDYEYALFYSTSSNGININNLRRPGNPYRNSFRLTGDRFPLQFVLGKKLATDREYTLSEVYTIRFTMTNYRSLFRISPAIIRTIPGAPDQELQVTMLPDTCEVKDVTWVSGDERLVRIKEKTDKGVMLQFGQSVGTTQITAVVKDYRGQECYASCEVRLSMTLPSPTFESDSGGETEEETADGDINYYWLIDKGGKVALSVKGAAKANIYYTTNGQDPVENGILYQSPITVNARTTIKAYAKLEGYADSPVNESEFRLGNPKLSISPAAVTIQQGGEAKVSFTLPTGADPSTITWDSSDSDIAQGITNSDTDDDGNTISVSHKIFSGAAAGKCSVTATITDYAGREQTAVCQVTVPGKFEITPTVTIEEEGTAAIMITKLPGGYAKDDVSWMVDSISDANLLTFGTDENGNKTITAGRLENTQEPRTVTVRASLTTDGDDICARCQVTIVPRQYTVNFFGYNGKLAKTEKVYRNQSATPPDEAVMKAAAPKGYRFNGWQEPDTAWKNIAADIDIHANYNLVSFNIVYRNLIDDSGTVLGTNPAANPKTYDVETPQAKLTLQDAVAAENSGKKFAGWYLDEDFSGSPIDEIPAGKIPAGTTDDLILYAKWTSAKTGQLHIESIANQPYTGKAIKPEVEVYDGETLLTLGTDYTVSYKNNTKAYTKPWTDETKAPTVTVKGKGNYKDSDTETFQIVPQSIAAGEKEVVIPDLYLAHTGKKLTITPAVTWNGKKLKNKTDFEVLKITKNNTEVAECIDEGDYAVVITGKGNFTGERTISLTVTKKTLLSKVSFKPNKLKDIPWTALNGKTLGEATDIKVNDGVILSKGSDSLKEGTDYTVTFDTSAKEVGIYTAAFTGIGENYAGTVTKTFKITGIPIKASNLDFGSGWKKDMPYDGTSLEQNLELSYKKDKNTLIKMTPGKDYTLTYENTTNAGNKAAVIITGINGYTGTVKKTFKIAPYSLKDTSAATLITTSLANGKDSVSYEKGGAKPKIIVKYGETVLTEGKDYTVTYKNNTKLASKEDTKAPSYTIKGKGNFKDSLPEKKFSIIAQDINKLSITAEDVMAAAPNTKKGETVGLTGKGKYKSTPKITDFNGKALSSGTDFLKTYTFTDENGVVLGPKDQVPENSILTVTVEGTQNYTGETKVSYRVLAAKKSVAKASVSLKKGVSKEYSLEPVTLKKEDLVVKLNGVELSGDNYTIVSYMNNRKKGTAKVTIQGVGEYGGSKTVNFKINPRKVAWFKAP